jgi:hypothetical protein
MRANIADARRFMPAGFLWLLSNRFLRGLTTLLVTFAALLDSSSPTLCRYLTAPMPAANISRSDLDHSNSVSYDRGGE